jgi:hypothetical protein
VFIAAGLFVSLNKAETDTEHNRSNNGESGQLSQRILSSLPYVEWAPTKDINKVSVTKYEPENSFKGINIFTSFCKGEAYLIDMKGKVLHTWSDDNRKNKWNGHVELCPNGDLLVILKDQMLMRLDWDSNIKWTNELRCHHEITLDENGDIYVLARNEAMTFVAGFPVPYLNDYIAVISSDGKTKTQIPLMSVLKKHIPFHVVPRIYSSIINLKMLTALVRLKTSFGYLCHSDTAFDIFHNNRITIISRDIQDVCKKGDLLICIRELDLIGILDIEKQEFVWSWGPGELSKPHYPTLLENGNILVFDNGRLNKRSRVIELDPVTKQIVWEYKENPPENFYTPVIGSCQRLPNGNTLITEGIKGRAFEVMSDGKIVWEFFNPEINLERKERAVIYRMIRIIKPENYSCLKDLY